MAEPLYCALAFNSISFGGHGGSRPCCAVDTHFWKSEKHVLPKFDNKIVTWFNNKDIVKLREDLLKGKWSPVCNMCKIREQAGQESTRQIFNNTLSKLEEGTGRSWKENKSVILDFSKIFLLDITVGNKCNSACLMCNDSASSLWKKEQEDIRGVPFTSVDPNWFSEKHVPELVDKLHNLSAIQFAGGEPTINDDHIFLLKRLIEKGRSQHITLGYVTNLTGVSPELLELWRHFKDKYITISVDGVGPVNEYQRYPFSWKKVTSQIDALKEIAAKEGNYQIGLSHTVTSLNLLSIDETVKWWESHVESGSGIAPWLPHVQCVNNPAYLDPVYMPKEMKDEVRETLHRLEKFIEEKNLVDKYLPVIKNITTNVLDVEVDEEHRRTVWLKMQKFLTDLDKYRGRNIFDYLPYMKKYWIEE